MLLQTLTKYWAWKKVLTSTKRQVFQSFCSNSHVMVKLLTSRWLVWSNVPRPGYICPGQGFPHLWNPGVSCCCWEGCGSVQFDLCWGRGQACVHGEACLVWGVSYEPSYIYPQWIQVFSRLSRKILLLSSSMKGIIIKMCWTFHRLSVLVVWNLYRFFCLSMTLGLELFMTSGILLWRLLLR